MMSAGKHIVVVGSGIAGLIAALQMSARHDVTLVTKLELMESNTRWAQGGIAAAMFPDDSVEEHIEDTLRAGAGLCRPEAVEVLCTEGPARIRDLIRLGVAFDKQNGELARGLEAAHSRARVLHARGDATGLSIETALVRAVRGSTVRVLEHTFACDLVLERGQIAGLEILGASGERERIAADAVILASGGAGQLFLHTTNPSGATGDGTAMALRAGAQIADAEFYQFHPTALATPETFLISEAVRGEGAVLLDARGRRFMQALHRDAELAPRDVVARGIALQMAAQDGKPVLLDATGLNAKNGSAEFLSKRFPSIDAACRLRGFDWTREPLPVTPAAHYWMGGVQTDLWGRTSIPGLYAVGEAACTGVHGANRLASNSLLESLVFAWRCAHLLLGEGTAAGAQEWPAATVAGVEILATDEPERGRGEAVNRRSLQALMWNAVGIERNGAELEAALEQMMGWRVEGTDVESLETANLLTLGRVAARAALERRESRGAHFRHDFPESTAAWQRTLVYASTVAVASR
ncbi:MAG TPA: L-aspartate oxidase [Acidobacteriaceae bacterium]|jgi:L-aspartate oxidase|nr:L-aspartate oxidase [Acidobacteriaceae bacterium]